MNTHKIKINSEINEILAGDSESINLEINAQKLVEILLKKNTNMKNKLLKIRNEMNKNNPIGTEINERKLKSKP